MDKAVDPVAEASLENRVGTNQVNLVVSLVKVLVASLVVSLANHQVEILDKADHKAMVKLQ